MGSHESKGCKLSQAFKGFGAFHGCRSYCLRLMAGGHRCHGYVVLKVPGAYRGLGVDGGRSAINLRSTNRIKSIFIFTSVFRTSMIKMIRINLKFVQYLAKRSVWRFEWAEKINFTFSTLRSKREPRSQKMTSSSVWPERIPLDRPQLLKREIMLVRARLLGEGNLV